jgi:hypothetical protein
VEWQDERVPQAREKLDLALEPLRPERGALFFAQDLERDVAAMLDVLREEDCGHTALAKLTRESVPAREGVAEGWWDADRYRHEPSMSAVNPNVNTLRCPRSSCAAPTAS